MMLTEILIKGFWAGFAAIGFAILFNVPQRTILPIWCIGAMGGLIKFTTMSFGISVVFASFFGAVAVGFVAIQMAHVKDSPPLIFSIPSVLPMIPGVFAYKFMLGMISLTNIENADASLQTLVETVNNGAKMMFVLIALGTGVAIPMILTRKESVKNSKFNKKKKALA